MEEASPEVYDSCHMCRVRMTICGGEHPSCRQCTRLYLQCIYHDKRIPRKFSRLSHFSKSARISQTKRGLIKRKGGVATEGLPLPDDKLMDLIHRAAIEHCESAFTAIHGNPFYYEFEASALMAFAVLAEELMSEYASKADTENDGNGED
jgi:hypothetical protein